jgi:hypothetical protein
MYDSMPAWDPFLSEADNLYQAIRAAYYTGSVPGVKVLIRILYEVAPGAETCGAMRRAMQVMESVTPARPYICKYLLWTLDHWLRGELDYAISEGVPFWKW